MSLWTGLCRAQGYADAVTGRVSWWRWIRDRHYRAGVRDRRAER